MEVEKQYPQAPKVIDETVSINVVINKSFKIRIPLKTKDAHHRELFNKLQDFKELNIDKNVIDIFATASATFEGDEMVDDK
jgi:hypothetical protein